MKKSFLIIYTIFIIFSPIAKASNLEPDCPKGKGQWFCYGFKLATLYYLGATIGTCASANGALSEMEGAKFAIHYTLNKFKSGDKPQVRADLYKLIEESSNYELQKKVTNNIKDGGGCAMVLNRYYPEFSRPEPKDTPSLRDTMSDTPFQW